MPQIIEKMLQHPRRLAFVGFNAALLVATAQFGGIVAAGLSSAGLVEIAIGYAGMAVALIALVGGWMGWSGYTVYRDRGRLRLGRRARAAIPVRARPINRTW
jgi:hypothetical protein